MWILLEYVVMALIGVFWITQVIWPLVLGVELFPWFKRPGRLKGGMVEAREILYEQNLEKQLEALKKESENG